VEWLLIVDINIGCKNLLQSVVNNNNIIYRTYDAVVFTDDTTILLEKQSINLHLNLGVDFFDVKNPPPPTISSRLYKRNQSIIILL